MATNPFFQTASYTGESNLLQDLAVEAIAAAGLDFLYLPRRSVNPDQILGNDDQSDFDTAYLLEFYVENFGGFEGDQSFMSKFGVEIRDQMIFVTSYLRFEEVVGQREGFTRPREKDLIYFPFNNKCFEIRYVDDKEDFFTLGSLPLFRCTTELFEYSDETFSTGIDAIDALQKKNSTNVMDYGFTDENGVLLTDENGLFLEIDSFDLHVIDPQADNDELTLEADQFLVWDETNPYGEDR